MGTENRLADLCAAAELMQYRELMQEEQKKVGNNTLLLDPIILLRPSLLKHSSRRPPSPRLNNTSSRPTPRSLLGINIISRVLISYTYRSRLALPRLPATPASSSRNIFLARRAWGWAPTLVRSAWLLQCRLISWPLRPCRLLCRR